MTIYSYEKSGRGKRCSELLENFPLAREFRTVTVLPIPTTKDGITLGGSGLPLAALPPLIEKGDLVVGYGVPEGLREELEDNGAVVCDALLDEEFLLDNGYLTALATVGIIITDMKKALNDAYIGVVGYGRIGKSLARMLLFLGARVKIYTSRPETCIELGESGISSAISEAGADLGELDILINTAPAVIFDTGTEGGFPEKLRVIDLASGENFPGLSSVERYPSIPAKMFPESAGNIWFRSVKRQLEKRRKERDGDRR